MTFLHHRSGRVTVLVAGLVLCQVLLFGPCLVGSKLPLALDLLALDGMYLPRTPEYRDVTPLDPMLSDQVVLDEMDRRFAASEWRAGRVPLWRPTIFAGAPFAAFPKYSPFNLLYYLFPSPFVLVWIQLLKSVFAGLGAYQFFRRVLVVDFWPAAFGAWCFPLTGFFIFCQGTALTFVTAWLPWTLLVTDAVIRRPGSLATPLLALVTGLVVVSGQLDMAGLLLVSTGVFALWRRPPLRTLGALTAAWLLGLALAAIYVLPLLEYMQTSLRLAIRAGGQLEDRPPIGLRALVQALIPDFYGTTRIGSKLLVGANMLENGAIAYTGLVATLLLAPLGWRSLPHRKVLLFWGVLGLVAFGWQLDIPGLVALLRLRPINLLPYNRFVFVTSFAVLIMAVAGMQLLCKRPRGIWVPALALAELLWTAHGVSPQADPRLYYPRIPALQQVAQALPGRIVCVGCLAPNLGETHGLSDIRGYDAVDPERYVKLLDAVRNRRHESPTFAATAQFVPVARGASLPGILNMLSLRYLIFRGEPPAEIVPLFRSPDYWVLGNDDALPRAFVPTSVRQLGSDDETLSRMAAPDFDPRQVAFVGVPVPHDTVRGKVAIVAETPTEITIDARMETRGLVVVADLWDAGWTASWNGQPAPMLRTNLALRGIPLPAGQGTLVLRYDPDGFAYGLRLTLGALMLIGVWIFSSAVRAAR